MEFGLAFFSPDFRPAVWPVFLESRIGCAGFFEKADLDMDGFGKSVTRRDGLR